MLYPFSQEKMFVCRSSIKSEHPKRQSNHSNTNFEGGKLWKMTVELLSFWGLTTGAERSNEGDVSSTIWVRFNFAMAP